MLSFAGHLHNDPYSWMIKPPYYVHNVWDGILRGSGGITFLTDCLVNESEGCRLHHERLAQIMTSLPATSLTGPLSVRYMCHLIARTLVLRTAVSMLCQWDKQYILDSIILYRTRFRSVANLANLRSLYWTLAASRQSKTCLHHSFPFTSNWHAVISLK